MNLKLTNQQKQYLMYFAIFVLGYLMCMYYPVHKKNNNVPMPILEGIENDDISKIKKITGGNRGGRGHHFVLGDCINSFDEVNNPDSCFTHIQQFLEDYKDDTDEFNLEDGERNNLESFSSTRQGIADLLEILGGDVMCRVRFPDENGKSICAVKGEENEHPCGPRFDDKCELIANNNNNSNGNENQNNTSSRR